jgi:hypothetical protein
MMNRQWMNMLLVAGGIALGAVLGTAGSAVADDFPEMTVREQLDDIREVVGELVDRLLEAEARLDRLEGRGKAEA